MGYQDLREWLIAVNELGELRQVEGAHWRLEMGTITELSGKRKKAPALLFDHIPDYPPGFRLLSGALLTAPRLAVTLGLPVTPSDRELVSALEGLPTQWETRAKDFPPVTTSHSPVKDNVLRDSQVDLLRFPAPLWHEDDGGRYIGTGSAVITQDPDTGQINLGTYRIMIHNQNTAGLYVSPGKHGRIHYEKYHAQGKPCPVAVSLGHDPLLLVAAGLEVPPGISEYQYAGAIKGAPLRVVPGEVTGLPIPADAELVIEGWCPPGQSLPEGPFGEWTGYYASGQRPAPVIQVEAIYYRNDPIILGCPPNRPPHDYTYMRTVLRSAMLKEALAKAGVPDVRGVWAHEAGGSRLILVVAIKQRYPGHARQAGFVASQCHVGAYLGRYVIVVDDDIDPSNTNDVLWALATRSDPEKDIDIIRRTWSSALDPMIKTGVSAFFNSRAIIDACRPFEWLAEFPKVSQSSPELAQKVAQKWRELLAD
ncbi:MAG: UbiD family decarboxylase [Chloroflexi bacterium]|nr:UbiD family decarboxylase [Chloroflexota bacterium]